jgi:hypothetical protein
MMLMSNDDRAMMFMTVVQKMQACERLDMDYEIKRLTDDYGIIRYEVLVPDKMVSEMIKRPTHVAVRERPKQADVDRVLKTLFGDKVVKPDDTNGRQG